MIVVVRVRNVLALNVLHFYIKAVGLDPRVVDAIEIVEGTVGNACPDMANPQEQSADANNCDYDLIVFHGVSPLFERFLIHAEFPGLADAGIHNRTTNISTASATDGTLNTNPFFQFCQLLLDEIPIPVDYHNAHNSVF
jgi:hypothetical protein